MAIVEQAGQRSSAKKPPPPPSYPVVGALPGRYVVRADDDTLGPGAAGVSADLALSSLEIHDKKFHTDLINRVTGASISRTIYGASTLSIEVWDWDREILNSRFVKAHSTVTIDGYKFALVQIRKQGDRLTLIFEDYAIAQLRRKTGAMKARRSSVTRAQFIEKLVKEVPGLKFYSPEKDIVQPVEPRPETEDGASGGNAAGASMGGGTRDQWARDLFAMMSPVWSETQENLDAMVAWITAEGTSAKWNPLATTQSATGATNFNSHGVKNYPDRATGLQATKETITNGFYAAIISAFQAANDPQRTTRAIDSSVWGTKHATGALPAVQSHRPEAYGGQIPGGSASTLMVTRAGLPTVTPLFPVGAAGPNPPTTPAPQPAYPSPVPDTDPPNANATRTHELGFPDGVDLTINGAAVTRTQKTNMEKVLNTGNRMGVRRMFMRAALIGGMRMTKMISESGDIRPNDQNFNQIGLFQFQQDQWPQLTLRSIQVSTEHFYRQARKAYANYQERRSGGIAIPGVLLDEASAPIIASLVLGGQPADYENYMTEANVAINAFFSGETDSPGVTDLEAMDPTTYIPYEFSRGTEDNPDEDSWSCITRLADEVNWRAFVVDDTVFYVRDDRLLRNKVLDTIEEFEEGVDYIDFDYDTGKPIATLSIGCRSTRWGVPPGTTIKIPKMGPATGKYIVSDINRSLFSASADITLVSPEPQLMEPAEQEGDLESGLGADFDTSRGTAKVLAWAMSKVPNPPKPSTYVLGAHHDISNSEANLDYMRTHPGAQPPFDCSSFVCWAWAQVGVYVGSVTGTQIQRAQSTQGVWCGGLLLGQGVSSGMQPEGGWQAGDLFFPHSGHVTMATGNGRECVEAKGSHYGIVISPNRIPDLPYFWCRWSAKIPEQYR